MGLPSLVLVEPDAAHRLQAVDALREAFAVHPVPPDEEPLRWIRRTRPDLVVVVLRSYRIEPTLRLCARIASEQGVDARLLLWNAPGLAAARRRQDEGDLARGYLEGEVSPEELVRACREVLDGGRPRVLSGRQGRLGALIRGLWGG